MKLLVASDLHYRLKQFDWLASQADHYDAMIIAGDMLDISSSLDLSVQIVVMQKCLKKISEKTPLLVCSGNHDGNEKNSSDEYIAPWLQESRDQRTHVDGDNIFFEDILFTIVPWWDGEITKRQVFEQIEQANRMRLQKWVWIYHAPPDKSPTSWVGKRFIGDSVLNGLIKQYQPDLVICGHIHESPFKTNGSWIDKIEKTWIFNAGSHFGDIPAHIIINLETMNAEWFSLAGSESQQLV